MTCGDCGDLAAAAGTFGIPHPTGYPLYVLACGAFVRLVSAGSVAWRANLFSALCSATAVMLLAAAAQRLVAALGYRASRLVCGALALAFGWSLTFWSQAISAEVYALNAVLLNAILLCVAHWYGTRNERALDIAALLGGLATANHLSGAMVGVAVVALVVALERLRTFRPGRVARWLGLFFLGLTPYLLFLWRVFRPAEYQWSVFSSWHDFWTHLFALRYVPFNAVPLWPPYLWVNLRVGAALWWREPMAVQLALAACALALMLRRHRACALFFAVAFGLYLALPLKIHLGHVQEFEVHYIGLYTFATLAGALALHALLDMLRTRTARGICVAVLCVCTAAYGARAWSFLPAVQAANDYDARLVLDTLPSNAIVFTTGDSCSFALGYYRCAEHRRCDCTFINAGRLDQPDFRKCFDELAPECGNGAGIAPRHASRPLCGLTPNSAAIAPGCVVLPMGLYYAFVPPDRTPRAQAWFARQTSFWSAVNWHLLIQRDQPGQSFAHTQFEYVAGALSNTWNTARLAGVPGADAWLATCLGNLQRAAP